jgi:hypothetical protein
MSLTSAVSGLPRVVRRYATLAALPVVRTSQIRESDLRALFQKQIAGIVVPQFLDAAVCRKASQLLLSSQIEEYTNAPGILHLQ